MSAIRSLDVVIPVYDEEAILPALLRQLTPALEALGRPWRVIFVDDGSRDRSWELLSDMAQKSERVLAIRLSRNYGQHAAIVAGFSACEADAVVTMDADLQNPPSEIGKLIEALEQGYDVAGGWRRARHDSRWRRAASRWMNRMVSKATRVPLNDYGCMLRAFRIEVVRRMAESPEIASFIPALAHCFTDRIIEVPVEHADRFEGESRYSLRGLVKLLVNLMTGFSMLPLRTLSLLGVITAAGGIAFGAFLMVMRIARGSEWAAEGIFTLFAVLFFFVGAQFLAFGLLGEYVGRIYDEVRRRPAYTIREYSSRAARIRGQDASPSDRGRILSS